MKKYLTLFPYLFYGLLIVFLFFYLKNIDYSQFKSAHFTWYYLLISGVIALIARFWQVNIWLSILDGLGAKKIRESRSELTYVYAKSWLGRYIPGTAPWILGKIFFASKHGVSKNKLAISSLLEGALQIAVVMSVAFIMLLFDVRLNSIDGHYKLLMVVVLIVCIISIWPPIFNRITSLLYKILRKKPLNKEHQVNTKIIFRGASMYALGALLSGLSLYFVAKAIYPELSYTNIFFVMGVGNLASSISMLAIFAPSGIGVREGIQLALLSIIMPTEIALLVTLTTRLWGVIMDFVFFGLAKLQKQFSRQQ